MELSDLALKLSEAGRMVGRIHTQGKAPDTDKAWSFWGVGATVVEHSDGDYVVTVDGEEHKVNP